MRPGGHLAANLTGWAREASNWIKLRPLGRWLADQMAPAERQPDGPEVQTELVREINFSSNTPLPVDVGQLSDPLAAADLDDSSSPPPPIRPPKVDGTLDDYWVRQPSDRKWGTITLAGSRLAERRARQAAQVTLNSPGATRVSGPAVATSGRLELVNGAWAGPGELQCRQQLGAGNRTLPRSFRSGPSAGEPISVGLGAFELTHEEPSPRQQFNSWLNEQLSRARRPDEAPAPAKAEPAPRGAFGSSPAAAPAVGPPTDCAEPHQSRPQPQWHKRSASQIEAQAMCVWPPAWAQLEPADWASMSFGPPALGPGELLVWPAASCPPPAHCLWPPADCRPQPVAGQPATSNHQLGKRNSLARSTLPLAAQANLGPTILAPPYHPAHDFRPPPCPFYPASLAAAQWPLPPAAIMGCAHDGPEVRRAAGNDDPVLTENACLGSYKRKRRLPHIEAQFTITREVSAEEAWPAAAATCAPGEGPSAAARRREREAVQSGRLFVREAPPDPPRRSPRPLGLPQAGQRTEQRRLRPELARLAQVECIGAREKIETYLRHYGRPAEGSPARSSSPVELAQVEELTFQPYHNLPTLKYTISLPLRSGADGQLLLEQTSHLRPRCSSRGRSTTLNRLPAQGEAPLPVTAPVPPPPPPKRRLGSSSSCPVPPVELSLATSADDLSYDLVSALRRRRPIGSSLEGALDHPTVRNRPPGDRAALMTADSLELGRPTGPQVEPEMSPEQAEEEEEYSSIREHRSLSPAPPVPPHGGRPAGGQQCDPNPSPNSNPSRQRLAAKSSSSSNPTNSDTASSSSSSSSTTATESGGFPASELLANDHSVDESYEFDQVSSCSSSAAAAAANRSGWRSRSRSAGETGPRRPSSGERRQVVVVGGAVYTQVKRARAKREEATGEAKDEGPEASSQQPAVVERTRFYDCSRRKELRLRPTTNSNPPAAPPVDLGKPSSGAQQQQQGAPNSTSAHYYDTVYEASDRR